MFFKSNGMTRYSILIILIWGCSRGYAQEPVVNQVSFKKDTIDIESLGGKADGITLNTVAINSAIDKLNSAGGGTVVIGPGFWLTGPVTLKSNVNLHLKKGAVLQFSDDSNQYPLIQTITAFCEWGREYRDHWIRYH
jgi:polygalacturonase